MPLREINLVNLECQKITFLAVLEVSKLILLFHVKSERHTFS